MADYIDRDHLLKSFCSHCIESGVDGKQCKEDCTDIVIIKNQRIADVVKGSDFRDCRNELCLRCGRYTEKHLGACDGCRWESGRWSN